MTDNYIGLTIRREVLEKDDVTVDIKTLTEIAVEAMKYYHKYTRKICPEIKIQKLFSDRLGIEEYKVKPESDLKISLSLEPENYAPFNCWMEVSCPNSKEWVERYLGTKYPYRKRQVITPA